MMREEWDGTVVSLHHCQVMIDGNRDPSAVGVIGLELTWVALS